MTARVYWTAAAVAEDDEGGAFLADHDAAAAAVAVAPGRRPMGHRRRRDPPSSCCGGIARKVSGPLGRGVRVCTRSIWNGRCGLGGHACGARLLAPIGGKGPSRHPELAARPLERGSADSLRGKPSSGGSVQRPHSEKLIPPDLGQVNFHSPGLKTVLAERAGDPQCGHATLLNVRGDFVLTSFSEATDSGS